MTPPPPPPHAPCRRSLREPGVWEPGVWMREGKLSRGGPAASPAWASVS